MVYYQSDTKQNMFNSYSDMTPVERSIADFFLSNTEKLTEFIIHWKYITIIQ